MVTAEALAEITTKVLVAAEALTEVIAVVLAVVKAMDADRKNSYIISAQSLIKSICALLLHQGPASKYYLQ